MAFRLVIEVLRIFFFSSSATRSKGKDKRNYKEKVKTNKEIKNEDGGGIARIGTDPAILSISNSTPSLASTNISPTKGTGIPLAKSCGFKAISLPFPDALPAGIPLPTREALDIERGGYWVDDSRRVPSCVHRVTVKMLGRPGDVDPFWNPTHPLR